MGRPKGGKNRRWSKEEKLRIVRRYYDERISQPELSESEGISKGHLWTWISKYQENGEEGLENKKKTGNKFSALHTSKKISEVERLKLELMKKDIEIERLKKGYRVEGAGAEKEYVTIKDVNMKSSKS